MSRRVHLAQLNRKSGLSWKSLAAGEHRGASVDCPKDMRIKDKLARFPGEWKGGLPPHLLCRRAIVRASSSAGSSGHELSSTGRARYSTTFTCITSIDNGTL